MKKEANTAISVRARSTLSTQWGCSESGNHRPIVWSIAGSDSGGGAGLQADLKAFAAFGVHGCTAVACITAQNSVAVTEMQAVDSPLLDAQLAALAHDMPPQVIKTGLLGSVENVHTVCRWVDRLRADGHSVALVVDPVLGASTGRSFAGDELIDAYKTALIPRATLVTPNQAEAKKLGISHSVEKYIQGSVVITGGDDASHSGAMAWDWLRSPEATGWLGLPRIDTLHTHGTGCTFASTAAAALACGYCVADAVVLAKMATTHALRHGYAAGLGAGSVCALPDFAQQTENLPYFVTQPSSLEQPFVPLIQSHIGLYAVVDSADWVRRVLEAGVRTVQLRIKLPQEKDVLRSQIGQAVAWAEQFPQAQLFINDHWELALECKAYGIHLGQEDLETADLAAIRAAGVRLGISTHSYWEVARAYALQPSYIACGPIFATQTKDMPWIPQSVENLRYWAHVLPQPVVGIAGINAHNISAIATSGCSGAAVVTAITQSANPEKACAELESLFHRSIDGC